MDPNHWNTYNLQYGHSASSGLPSSHPSLTRLDLTTGLGLSHTLQTTHGSLTGRPVSAIPAVSYQTFAMPLLEPLTAGISGTQPQKSMSLSSGQLVFEQQVRNAEQQSPSNNRYDSSKSFRSDSLTRDDMVRNQLLEAAAARVLSSSNFSSPSLYNQFGSVLSDVSGQSSSAVSPSAGAGSSNLAVSRSNQLHMHEPPPAHSSSSTRLSSIQRNPHAADIRYGRGSDSLMPSNLAQISSLYNSVSLGKQNLGVNLQQSVHRQTPVHIQHGFTSSSEIEDLSSSTQNQLYSSYASMSVADPQDFSDAQLSGDISYEAVSPAPPMGESSQNNQEPPSFSMVQFPELINLTPEHAHTLADKFQENDFRLKLDSRVQQHQQDTLTSIRQSQRQEVLKIPKDMSSFQSPFMQVNQHGSQFQTVSQAMNTNISQNHSAAINMNQSSSLIQSMLTNMSMQQSPAPISVQAPADSTTKPKRTRGRKKKGEANPPAPGETDEIKKSSPSPVYSPAIQQQQPQLIRHPSLSDMPLASQHISTLPMSSSVSHSSPVQQQQTFRSLSSNQFTSRDAQRAQTPSMPQTYTIQDHQTHSYTPVPSPKINHPNVLRSQSEFALPNEKSSATSSCKQQKKSGQATPKNNSNQIYRSNIPDNQQHIQNFAGHAVLMGNTGQHRASPMQDSRTGSINRLQSFSNSPQQKMACQMSPIGQPSPQGSIGADGGFGGGKIGNSSHLLGTALIGSQPPLSQSPMDSQPVSVDATTLSHSYEQNHQTGLIDGQDSSHFQIDFTGQPFLEQLVGVPPPLAIPSTSFSHAAENGEVVFTTLVTPAENARLQQQHQDSTSSDNFRPTYHGEAVHDIQPIGQIGGHLGMEDVSFNAFFDSQRDMDQQGNVTVGGSQQHLTPESEKMTLTFIPHLLEDEELGHFSQMLQSVPMMKKELQDTRPGLPPKDSFQNSFVSYLQGHKQETLSSVSSSAVTKKPLLPKYIPEPRRPRPAPVAAQLRESLNFSDTEDSQGVVSSRVKDLISGLSDNENSSIKSESDREGYSVQRTSELAVKITLPKNKKNMYGPFAEMTQLKDRTSGRDRDGQLKRKRRRGKRRSAEGEDYMPGNMSEEEASSQRAELTSKQPTPPPVRTSIGRKAKDKCLEKTKKRDRDASSGSSSDESFAFVDKGKAAVKNDSDRDYDSDKDPVWMPFELGLKQGHDVDEKRKKPRRTRTRTLSTKSGKSLTHQKSTSFDSLPSCSSPSAVNAGRPSQTAASTAEADDAAGDSQFQTGMYMIEKKDLQNYESYPVWRLEPGNMMRKFEIKADGESGGGGGAGTQHHAVGTFSTWTPSMESQFVLVKVREILGKTKGDPVTVEVVEEYRPKPPIDGRLELQYEDDPLVEPFNIYLQVFLSQALEPSFLSAIKQANEKFYVDVLNQIDGLIESKCREITRLAHWKVSFQEYLHMCPLMKEIDRPNLKQACQASENSHPPTIKSVILSGHPYDRFLLTEKPSGGSDVAQEFMIGKVAAYYVRTYHSLYHFKYWLWQRCETKVKMMKESNKLENLTDEEVLDKCLLNRSWVLQLFDSFKSLLRYGEDVAR